MRFDHIPGIKDRSLFQRFAIILFMPLCLRGDPVLAKTIDTSPRPTILLKKTDQFIAQNGWNSIALYNFEEKEPVRTFQAGKFINEIDASADEQLLVIACANGELSVWNIQTGAKLWGKSALWSDFGFIYDASFSHDGKSLVVCNNRDFAGIFNALTGERLGTVSFPAMQTNIMSATLSPEGSEGALVDLGERLFTFEAATGRIKETGLKGGWPVRYSADGKYVALRSSNSGTNEHLRVVSTIDLAKRDVGQFDYIGHIKPVDGGGFLVCAEVGRSHTVGAEYEPISGELREVWKLPSASVGSRTDFDTRRMIGVSTDFRLVTQLLDLRTGKPRLTIDNSANYRETIVTFTSADLRPFPVYFWVGAIIALAFFAWILSRLWRCRTVRSK